ncbi:hypothetical protein CONCODRAFT_10218 [Conidiobolus coronatus NRRL 28638]|uniref:Uncharacterized protein n=1 Tax=Conidiobolus coronatus (strain ATCC 28846 / CBS 209.66 / NRRL 28638) TaxID=796925 RepID=A0A137NY81_CONC2|nr:hypothetical protein CONCODRAFT_10218 [Conidiobolus coronatus NRRL 28638]|eukprot:KXN67672.1 hypothetical protein CONCODRAFT_10218 [Conidiobolus coronatus NRRL 28638]
MDEMLDEEGYKALDLLFSELENNLSDDSGIEGFEYDKNIDQEQLPFDDEIQNETNEDVIRLKLEQRKIRDRIDSIQLLYESIKERSFYPRLQKLEVLESEIKESDSHQVIINQEKLLAEHNNLLKFHKKKKLLEVQRIQNKLAINSGFYREEYQESIMELKCEKIRKLHARKMGYLRKIERFRVARRRDQWSLKGAERRESSQNRNITTVATNEKPIQSRTQYQIQKELDSEDYEHSNGIRYNTNGNH